MVKVAVRTSVSLAVALVVPATTANSGAGVSMVRPVIVFGASESKRFEPEALVVFPSGPVKRTSKSPVVPPPLGFSERVGVPPGR